MIEHLKNAQLLKSQCLVGGEWIDADNKAVSTVRNPSTNDAIAAVPSVGATETDRAIAAAERALPTWSRETAEHRATILRRWCALMLQNQEDLAVVMTQEQGKPLAEARAEIAYAASYIEWFAEEARRAYGLTVPSPWPDKRILVTREPVGVCAAITPWNFPAAMITRKVAPALAAGCTSVVKPALQTPLSALAMAHLAVEAGVPPGVMNVVTGNARAIGAALTASPVVRKLTFTGSTEVGRVLAAQCAPTLKRLSLELGGNAPFIVFGDADLDAAVQGAIAAKFRNTGQTCVCANRILVQDDVYEAFLAKLRLAVGSLRVGDGMDPETQLGPLIDANALSKVQELVADAVGKGARLLVGGKAHERGGTFYEPTLIADVTTEMCIAREEIFGPVAPVMRFRTEEEAISLANATEFGLAAYFYSRDVSRVFCVAAALQCGMVGANTGVISTAVAPFGGVKQSGLGREGGSTGIDEYLSLKYLCVQ